MSLLKAKGCRWPCILSFLSSPLPSSEIKAACFLPSVLEGLSGGALIALNADDGELMPQHGAIHPSNQFSPPLVNVLCCFHRSDSEGTFDTPEESPGVEQQLGQLEDSNPTGERAAYADGTREWRFPEVVGARAPSFVHSQCRVITNIHRQSELPF